MEPIFTVSAAAEAIENSYSAQLIAKKSQIKKPVPVNGKLVVAVGGLWGKDAKQISVVTVTPRQLYHGETCTYSTQTVHGKSFYEGMLVKQGKEEFVLSGSYYIEVMKPQPKAEQLALF